MSTPPRKDDLEHRVATFADLDAARDLLMMATRQHDIEAASRVALMLEAEPARHEDIARAWLQLGEAERLAALLERHPESTWATLFSRYWGGYTPRDRSLAYRFDGRLPPRILLMNLRGTQRAVLLVASDRLEMDLAFEEGEEDVGLAWMSVHRLRDGERERIHEERIDYGPYPYPDPMIYPGVDGYEREESMRDWITAVNDALGVPR